MKVTAFYFSPTGGSKKSATSIAAALSGSSYNVVDITRETAVPPKTFAQEDFVVFGFPCYNGRVPEIAVQRMGSVKGNKTPCIITITYGNRDYDDSLLELYNLVTEKGFLVQAAAALVAQHTYGEIQVGRPDASDEDENRLFAEKLRTIRKNDFSTPVKLPIKGKLPYSGEGKGVGFHPLTSDECINCGQCAVECPAHAIADDNCTIDASKCLSCFRCIRICPMGAKNMNSEGYLTFAKEFSKKLSARRENEYIF